MDVATWLEELVGTDHMRVYRKRCEDGVWYIVGRRPRRGSWYQFMMTRGAEGWSVARCSNSPYMDRFANLKLRTGVRDLQTMIAIWDHRVDNYGEESAPEWQNAAFEARELSDASTEFSDAE